MPLLNSSQNSTGYIQTGEFSPCTLFPDLLPPNPLADLLTIYLHITIKLRCLHRTPFSAVVRRQQRWMRRPTSPLRRRWLHWLRPRVRLEAVHRNRFFSVAHLQPEHLLAPLQDRVGSRVQRRKRWQGAASPDVDARARRQTQGR
jgi:hypothetical protein